MEYLIEQKVIDLLKTALQVNEIDSIPQFILPYAEDWEDPEDFPAIVVQVDGEENIKDQISNVPTYLKAYSLYMYAICVADLWEDVVFERNILKTRIINYLKLHQDLDRLTDTESTEKVFLIQYVSADFSVAGFSGMWQSMVRIKYEVQTEVKP